MKTFVICILMMRLQGLDLRIIESPGVELMLHDACNENDLGGSACGLPPQCCCKTSHNTVDNNKTATRILCVNLTHFPTSYPMQTTSLELIYSDIEIFPRGSLALKSLNNTSAIYIKNFPWLHTIGDNTFADLPGLKFVWIENAPMLSYIESNAFNNLPKLSMVKLSSTGITTIPSFHMLSSSHEPLTIEIINSDIEVLRSNSLNNFPERLAMFNMRNNGKFTTIENYAFNGTSISVMSLQNNPALTTLGDKAFVGARKLIELNISNTAITRLPTKGLHRLDKIIARNVPNMVNFPSAYDLQSLKVAELTYPFHCCALGEYGFGQLFKNKKNRDSSKKTVPCEEDEQGNLVQVNTNWIYLPLSREKRSYSYYGSGEYNYYVPLNYTEHEYIDYPTLVDIDDGLDKSKADDLFNGFISAGTNDAPVIQNHTRVAPVRTLCLVDEDGNLQRDVYFSDVTCSPLPDEFNPCENVLGTTVLPVVSWTVSCLAIIGNMFVILVLSVVSCDKTSASHHHLSVSKFLVLNLALADLCMGIYLLMLSIMDAITAGEYYKFGAIWQTGAGCNIAGFLAILSSQLSIYILCVISIERWYAIHFAIHLDKRMTMRCARILVMIGWAISITLALLPVFSVNNYHKASICLPMDTSTSSGLGYVAMLLLTSIVSFLVVVTCYLWMYTTVRTVNDSGRDGMFRRKRRSSTSSSKNNGGSPVSSTVDATIAKRMAVLVFTNFACFFPISFFVLTAAAGHPLISISNSKILLVIFYPLNSCCNPFLYAILTKSFRRDLLTWLTFRGYCIRFASKRHGAQWRRQSTNCGKKETYMRRKIQQCVKYVVRYKAVNIEHESKESNNVKQIDHNDNTAKAKCAQTSLPPDKCGLIPTNSISKIEDQKSSSESYDCENITVYPPLKEPKTRTKFFLPFFGRPGRRSEYKCKESSDKNSCAKSLLVSGRCWKARNSNLEIHEGNQKDSEENMLDSVRKTSKTYKYKFNKPRHSTSTIETRLTASHKINDNENYN